MEDTLNILKDIKRGEIIKIKYNGGSQPGAVREIAIRNIDENKGIVYAYCVASDRVINFNLSKIEIADKNDELTFVKVDTPPKAPSPINLKDLQENYIEELEKKGWFVKITDNSVELFEGVKETATTVSLFYEAAKKDWVLKTENHFTNQEMAIDKFWKQCGKMNPKK
ncbi:MAG: hypothetical protein LBC64_07610 [Fibromonadaceae bacterium]|jgi:hypothetical protein|nr:hypothetical protein [Fibromonadaceae bacterium]